MKTKKTLLAAGLAVIASICMIPTGIMAGEETDAVSKNPVPEDSPWEKHFRLDGWIVQIDVALTDDDLGIDSSIFLGFDDIISNIDWIVPLGMDVRYNRFGFNPDIVGMKTSGHTATPHNGFNSADVSLKFVALNLVGYYRLIDEPGFSLDLMGGARLLYIDTKLALSGGVLGGLAGGTVRSDTSEYIWNGVIGGRVEHSLGDKWFYWVYGDVGTGDSELTWQVWANIGYRIKENFTASLGYRYLTWDQNVGSSADLGLTASGPIITFNWEY